MWVAEPYIPANDPIIYVSELIGSGYSYPAEYRSPFIANLTGLTRSNNELQLANLTSELTFLANTVDNETSIRCETYAGDQPSTSSSTFFKAGEMELHDHYCHVVFVFFPFYKLYLNGRHLQCFTKRMRLVSQ